MFLPAYCPYHINMTVPDNLTEVLTVDDNQFHVYTEDSKYLGKHLVNFTFTNDHSGVETNKAFMLIITPNLSRDARNRKKAAQLEVERKKAAEIVRITVENKEIRMK